MQFTNFVAMVAFMAVGSALASPNPLPLKGSADLVVRGHSNCTAPECVVDKCPDGGCPGKTCHGDNCGDKPPCKGDKCGGKPPCKGDKCNDKCPTGKCPKKCPGDQEWCGWSKSCQCEKPYVWDKDMNKCHHPVWPKPRCNKDEKAYCVRGEKDWCEYDAKNSTCWNDGHNKVFCSCLDDLPHKTKDQCPDDHPKCDGGRVWDSDLGMCRCTRGKVWRDGKCCHKPMPRPGCDGGSSKKPYCADHKKKWCPYDGKKDQCADTGKHVTFCCEPGKEQDWVNQHWEL